MALLFTLLVWYFTLIDLQIFFLVALFTTAQIWIQPKYPSTEEWIKKMWNIYIMGHLTQPSKRKKLSTLQHFGWT